MAGIIWARHAFIPATFCWILIILLATRLLVGLRRPTGVFGKYLILPLFFLLGGVHTPPFLHPPENPQHIYNQIKASQEVVLIGVLTKAPEMRGDKSRLLVEATQIKLPDKVIASTGMVLITMAGKPPAEILPGDMVIAKIRLSRPRNFGVEGAFNYAEYLSNQKIWITGWLSSPYLLHKIHQLPSPSLSQKAFALPEKFRQKIGSFLDTILPVNVAGIYKAILIGDRAGIPTKITESYTAAGNIHLLAISGLHIGLLAFFLSAAFAWLIKHSERLLIKWPVWKTAALLSSIPLAMYALVAGAQTSVLRAIIMTYIFMGAIIWNRQGAIFNSLAFAALLLLAINPSDLFTVSFQLSFAAVGSIALIFPKIANLFRVRQKTSEKSDQPGLSTSQSIKAFCLASVLISFAASLGTAPILAYHFNRIPLLSPLSTLLVEPLLCFWSLVLGLLACLFISVPLLASGLFQAGSWGISAANRITDILAGLPFASLWTITPSLPMILSYYGILNLLLVWLPGDTSKAHYFHSKRRHTVILLLFILTCLSLPPLLESKDKADTSSTISVLDVGQGLATVVQLPKKKVFIIDAGKHQASKANRFNVGRDIIAPFLWEKRIRKVTAIILSHPDSDHSNGIPFLLEHFQPEVIWTNSAAMGATELKQLRDIAAKHQIPIKVPESNETIYSEGAITLLAISTLHRDKEELGEERTDEKGAVADNNKSLVVRLRVNSHSCIFTGDIEQEAENQLIEQGVNLESDILIAPHHGSKTSSSDDFIKHVSAEYVVISAGSDNQDIFPSPERMRKYQESGSTILSTAQSGTVSFKISNTIEVETFY